MYTKLLMKINEYDKIIIHRHHRPDGDALGSQVGLKRALLSNFPTKKIYAVGDVSERLSFIGQMDNVEDNIYQDSLVIVLDTPEEVMISDDRYKLASYLIKIDHHIQRSSYGDLEIIDISYESCASLISDILYSLELKIEKEAAEAFFTGIVTDSGRFRYDSVTPKTFIIASKLLETGFKTSNIYNNLYVDDLKTVRLRSLFALKFQLTKNNVAYIMTSKDELKEYEVDFFTASRGMVNTMSGIKGIDIWVNFTEDEVNNVVVAELRSNKYNINQIATKYGGGGHLLASGASLRDFTEAREMLEDLDNLIEVQKNE